MWFQQHPSASSHAWRYALKSGPAALLHIKTGNKWNFKLKFVPLGNALLLLPVMMPNFDRGVLCQVLSYSITPQCQFGLFSCFTVLRYHLSILIWDDSHQKPHIRLLLFFILANFLSIYKTYRSLCSKHDTLLPTSFSLNTTPTPWPRRKGGHSIRSTNRSLIFSQQSLCWENKNKILNYLKC